MGRILDRYLHRKTLGRWRRAAQQAPNATQSELRQQREQARNLRGHLDRLIQQADTRLLRPKIGSVQFSKPVGTDWSWRPDLWRGPLTQPGAASAPRKTVVDDQVSLFHDCPLSQIAVRQIRNRGASDLAPFSLMVEAFSFEGSFLSVSVELPGNAALNLTREHLMRVETLIECENPSQVFARLNIQHGPNMEKVLRSLDPSEASSAVDFDLAHLPLNERRIEKIWLDLIFENPEMNRIVVRDLTFCRFHRADL
ncbi:DUF6478 family protein [uncultured Ruegeria sp.]|uniref:DUF6478 family protein n=1 Tax=uncultured Ruegeria sp. TaxID=259304 RepID=UPI002623FBF6|nr:DUF6478 family protein [uncultured Ruegeria sp.]